MMMCLWLVVLCCLCTSVYCNPLLQHPLVDDALFKEDKYLARAEKLMKQTPMIDGHNVASLLYCVDIRTYPC
jgi:hypothetical protein